MYRALGSAKKALEIVLPCKEFTVWVERESLYKIKSELIRSCPTSVCSQLPHILMMVNSEFGGERSHYGMKSVNSAEPSRIMHEA